MYSCTHTYTYISLQITGSILCILFSTFLLQLITYSRGNSVVVTSDSPYFCMIIQNLNSLELETLLYLVFSCGIGGALKKKKTA